MRQILIIAGRDFLQRAKSKAFLISILVVVGLVAVIGPIIAMESRAPDPWTLGLVTNEPNSLEAEFPATARAMYDRSATVTRFGSEADAKEALADGRIDVLLLSDTELLWQEDVSSSLQAAVTAAAQNADRRAIIEETGLTDEEVSGLLAPPPLDSATVVEPDPEEVPRTIAAYAGVILLYISIIMFGQFVLMGVLEEKASRVVEVVLSRARPSHLLAGKVLGIGLLGLIQFVIIGVAVLASVNLFDIADVDLTGISLEALGWLLFWYLLGFGFFSVIYAAMGATISRQEDAQSANMIPVFLLLPGYFIALTSLDNPDSTLARISSMVPPLSPMVMPVRSAVGNVPAWELATSVGLLLLASLLLIRVAGRIYEGSILRLGAKVKLKDAWKAACN